MEYSLIELVKNEPTIYDKKAVGYKNTILKKRKWQNIAAKLNTSVYKAKNRWKTLRDRYLREKRLKLRSWPNVLCSSKKEWRYTQFMNFLDDSYFLSESKEEDNKKLSLLSEIKSEHNETDGEFGVTIYGATSLLGDHNMSLPHGDIPGNCDYNGNGTENTFNNIPTAAKHEENTAVNDALQQMSEFVKATKDPYSATSVTPAQAFFCSIAVQVENAALSFDRFSHLQLEIMKIVHKSIKQQNKEDSNYRINGVRN